MTSSPIVARWELSRRLSTRRKELGLGVSTITDALGFTRNYWSAVENDRTLIAEDKLRQLFGVLEFEEPDRSELLALRETSRERGWWDDYSNSLDKEMKRFYGLEDGATRILAFDGNLIPGLLQTEQYAREIFKPDPAFSELEIDDLLAVRLRRQQLLKKDDAPEFIALLSEAALLQQLAGPAIQLEQLRHIVNTVRSSGSSIQIRIIPFTRNPGLIAQSSTLLFFEFNSNRLPRLVWQEAVRMLDFIESGEEQFRRLEYSWNEGLRNSLNCEESISIVERIIDTLT